MSRSKLQSIKSQGRLNQHKARIQQHIIASICLIAVAAAVALWGGDLSRVAAQAGSRSTGGIWEDVAESSIPTPSERETKPRAYRTLRLNEDALRGLLANAPMEFTKEAKEAPVTILFPMPDGKFGRFKVVESPMMEAELAAKYPEFKTYSGIGIDDPSAVIRFGLTFNGFHAIILASSGTIYIDPYAKGDTEHYIGYDKRDYLNAGEPFHRGVSDDAGASRPRPPRIEPKFVSYGFVRFYRLAMAVDFNNDGVPELAAGRLPARTVEETAAIVNKLMGYAVGFTPPSALLVANANDGFNFEQASAQLRTLLPSS